MRRKKICVYINSLNASGGIERIVTQLVLEWKKKYDIFIITKDEGISFYGGLSDISIFSICSPRTINMHNRLQRILKTFFNTISSVIRLRKFIKDKDFDYIYVTTPLNAFEVYLAGVECNKIVVGEHGSAYGINKIYSMLKKFVYPKVRCISVPNKMDVEYYQTCGFNAVYIPHIVKYKDKGRNTLKEQIVLNIGRLTADKQQSVLIENWARVKNKGFWKLWIVGDGEEKDDLEKLICKLGVEDSVQLLPATQNIEEVYRKATIFAFTSRYEGFGLVLTEAMSFGIPCIAFDCPSGPRDIVENGKNGFLIENGNREDFTIELEKMMKLPHAELKKLGEKAYETIQNWNNDAIIEQWNKIFV